MPEVEIPLTTEIPLVEIFDIGQLFHVKIGNRIVISDVLDYASDDELKKIIKDLNIKNHHYGKGGMMDAIRRSRCGDRISDSNSCNECTGRIFMPVLLVTSVAINMIVFLCWYILH